MGVAAPRSGGAEVPVTPIGRLVSAAPPDWPRAVRGGGSGGRGRVAIWPPRDEQRRRSASRSVRADQSRQPDATTHARLGLEPTDLLNNTRQRFSRRFSIDPRPSKSISLARPTIIHRREFRFHARARASVSSSDRRERRRGRKEGREREKSKA